METDLQLLGERVRRLLEITRQLSDENQLLRGRLGEAAMSQADMQQRLAEARARVESALARLPLPQPQRSARRPAALPLPLTVALLHRSPVASGRPRPALRPMPACPFGPFPIGPQGAMTRGPQPPQRLKKWKLKIIIIK